MACRELLVAVCVCVFLSAGSNADDCKSVSSMSGHMKAANIGKCYALRVNGVASGKVWGTNVYTSNSDIGTAAVHAGLLRVGETGVVNIRVLRGRWVYISTSRYGIRTRSSSGWPLSYFFLNQPRSFFARCKSVSTMSGHMKAANIGKCYELRVRGATNGIVWGNNIYKSDSNISTAAVHAGFLTAGEPAQYVTVQLFPGLISYRGTSRNGIRTSSYHGSWPLSYAFVENPGTPKENCKFVSSVVQQKVTTNIGKCYELKVKGVTYGALSGDKFYNEYSNIGKAAVHAGLLKVGETGHVRIRLQHFRYSYEGTRHYGIQSRWSIPVSWLVAFTFV